VMITERLRIREITTDDLPALFRLYDDPDVTAYIEPLFPYEEEREYTENYIKYVYGLYGYGMWIVERKSGDSWEMIGRAGIEQKNDRLEMGYMLGNAFRHMGYAYEACSAILLFAWENTDEQAVYCVVNKKNKASIRLLEKLGFLPHFREDMEGSESIYIKNRPNGL
nr:GNAT family N-acetyltransferase [Lachnospiraceae bacterium]